MVVELEPGEGHEVEQLADEALCDLAGRYLQLGLPKLACLGFFQRGHIDPATSLERVLRVATARLERDAQLVVELTVGGGDQDAQSLPFGVVMWVLEVVAPIEDLM